jgi:hypothetical protein
MAVWSPVVTEKLTGEQFFIQFTVVCLWDLIIALGHFWHKRIAKNTQ